MDAVEYIKQHIRICNAYDCDDCPLHGKCAINGGVLLRDDKDIIASVATVEQWEKDNPQETRLSKLLKQYPKAKAEVIKENYPCPAYLGYSCPSPKANCKDCWDSPIEE